MSWDDARADAPRRAPDIGAHSRTHPHLSGPSTPAAALDETGRRPRHDLQRSAGRADRRRSPIRSAPCRRVDGARRGRRPLRHRACTTEHRAGRRPPTRVHLLPRLDMFYFPGAPRRSDDWGTAGLHCAAWRCRRAAARRAPAACKPCRRRAVARTGSEGLMMNAKEVRVPCPRRGLKRSERRPRRDAAHDDCARPQDAALGVATGLVCRPDRCLPPRLFIVVLQPQPAAATRPALQLLLRLHGHLGGRSGRGFVWAFGVGFVAGWFVGFVRNFVTAVWIFFVRTRAQFSRNFLDHI